MKYCEFCGKELLENEQCVCSESQQKQAKNTKWRKGLIYAGIPVVIVVLVIGILLGSTKIDPFEYISVSFDGYNTNGSVTVQTDSTSLISKIVGEAPNSEDVGKYFAWVAEYEAHASNIDVEYAPTEELSNGDEVTVTVTVSGDTASEVKSGSKTFKVEGLKDIVLVDVFTHLDVTFDGVNGSGTAKVTEKIGSDDFIGSLRFNVEGDIRNGALSNGDIINVVVTCSDSNIESFGKAPKEKSKSFTVSGLNEYVTVDTLPTDDITDIANEFIAEKTDDLEPTSMFTYSDVELYGVYFAENVSGKGGMYANELHILIGYTMYMNGEYHSTSYFPLYFRDLLISDDGTVAINYEDGRHTGLSYSDPEKYINELKEDYDVTKIEQ